jgi:hypothetical protein
VVFQTSYSGILIYPTYRISQKIVVKGILKPIKYAAQDKKKMKYGLQIIIGDYRISYNDALKLLRWRILHRKVKKDTNDFGVKYLSLEMKFFLIHKHGILIIQFQPISEKRIV